MNITELDEWQGVTPELVTDWLLSHGWTQKPTQPNWWLKGDDGFLFDAPTFGQVWFWAYALAAIYADGNVQALLREINPRMRKGVPSQEAITAHGGTWMAAPPLGRNGIVFVNLRVLLDPSWAEWSFWPCDDHGNKVLWPTDANGALL